MKTHYLFSIKSLFNWRTYLTCLVVLSPIAVYLTVNFHKETTSITSGPTTIITPYTDNDNSTNKGNQPIYGPVKGSTITQINGGYFIYNNLPIKEKNPSYSQVNSSSSIDSPDFPEINDGNDGNGSRTIATQYLPR